MTDTKDFLGVKMNTDIVQMEMKARNEIYFFPQNSRQRLLNFYNRTILKLAKR